MRRWGLWLIVGNLCALLALAFLWPQLMVAPGPLIPAHHSIASNCFACHAPLRGVVADRCITCHKLADIGIRFTDGAPTKKQGPAIAFHQALTQPDCMACHSDHAGPQLTKASRQRFNHSLLRPELQTRCASCHQAPATVFHVQAGTNCAACHTQAGWKPATFNHVRYFSLTGPHNATCATCHTGGDTSRYTCFGCHEHRPAQIRAEHAEEGIRSIENCARCHRSGSGEGAEGGERGGDD